MNAPRRHFLLILNPKAGSIATEKLKIEFKTLCEETNTASSIVFLNNSKDLKLLRQKVIQLKIERVIICGGDGTISSVANSLLGIEVELAIVPAGTANIIAREFSVPKTFSEALQLAVTGTRCLYLDALKYEKRSFFSHVSVGAYSSIAARTNPSLKKRFGRVVYLFQIARILFHSRAWDFSLSVDGTRVTEIKASTLMVANTSYLGLGKLQWDVDARVDDGLVSVCVVSATNILEYCQVLRSFSQSTQKNCKYIKIYQARKSISFVNASAYPLRVDGETIDAKDVTLEVIPRAIKIVSDTPN